MSSEENDQQPGPGNEARPRAADIRTMVELVAKMLVEKPAEVEVEEFQDRGTTIFELIVSPTDLGRIIGKSGRTAKALRSLVEAAGDKMQKRCMLDIVDVDEVEDAPLAQ